MKQIALMNTFPIEERKDVQKKFPYGFVLGRLTLIMSKHCGKEKAIATPKLFREIFGNPEKYTMTQLYFLMGTLRQSMATLRNKKIAHIEGFSQKGLRMYYVPTNESELKEVHMRIDKRIVNAHKVKQFATYAVKNKLYLKLSTAKALQ